MQVCVDLVKRFHDAAGKSDAPSAEESEMNDAPMVCTIDLSRDECDAFRGFIESDSVAVFWNELNAENVSLRDVTNGIVATMSDGSLQHRVYAATIYTGLLRAPESPVRRPLLSWPYSDGRLRSLPRSP